VDALFGTGLARPIAPEAAALLGQVRQAAAGPGGVGVVAVDLPSGLNADTGAADPATVRADLTVTFGCPKRGLVLPPGSALVGDLEVADIGLDPPDPATRLHLASAEAIAGWLPPRDLLGHKGRFGRVLVAGGSRRYGGAPALAALGAYRAGAGLVTLAAPASRCDALISLVPEATLLPLPDEAGDLSPAAGPALTAAWAGYDALVLGPGLGTGPGAAATLAALLAERDAECPGTWVVDADALNLLAAQPEGPAALPAPAILTPHPGEMGRLVGSSAEAVNADRLGVSTAAAARWGHVVVLKGAHTVTAAPAGDTWVNPFATSALATAGSGDVLAGLIAGLSAQGAPPLAAAVLAAWLHGAAGQALHREIADRGHLARDIAAALPAAINRLARTR
jgi:NAD(P)H-hydrate epimerase